MRFAPKNADLHVASEDMQRRDDGTIWHMSNYKCSSEALSDSHTILRGMRPSCSSGLETQPEQDSPTSNSILASEFVSLAQHGSAGPAVQAFCTCSRMPCSELQAPPEGALICTGTSKLRHQMLLDSCMCTLSQFLSPLTHHFNFEAHLHSLGPCC